jgi:hypothetical protein
MSLKEAQVVIESWREEYNTRRPHRRSAIGRRYRRPRAPWLQQIQFHSPEL